MLLANLVGGVVTADGAGRWPGFSAENWSIWPFSSPTVLARPARVSSSLLNCSALMPVFFFAGRSPGGGFRFGFPAWR